MIGKKCFVSFFLFFFFFFDRETYSTECGPSQKARAALGDTHSIDKCVSHHRR